MTYGRSTGHIQSQPGADALDWPQIFLRILLILSVFESDRSNMMLSSIIARFKDIDIVLFFGAMVVADGWKLDRRFFCRSAYGWMLLYVLFSFPITFYSGQTQYGQVIQLDASFAWAVYLRMLYFCFLMCVLPRYFSRYPADANRLARLFVLVCVAFVVFNVVAYFYKFPFMATFRPQPGRISNGYPTSDALMLGFGLVAHFLFTSRMRWWDILITVVLILGLLANLTASGVICLVCMGLLYATLNIVRRPIFVISLLGGALMTIGAAAYAAYRIILIYSPLDLNTTLSLIVFKLQTSGAGTGTFAIRIQQYVDAEKYMESYIDRIFGLGSYYGFIEIQYAHVFLVWGFIGLVLFGLTFYENVASALAENRSLALYYSLVWIIGGTVLITTYLFPLMVPFALLAAMGTAVVFPRSNHPTEIRGA